jgi:hypothetical protein
MTTIAQRLEEAEKGCGSLDTTILAAFGAKLLPGHGPRWEINGRPLANSRITEEPDAAVQFCGHVLSDAMVQTTYDGDAFVHGKRPDGRRAMTQASHSQPALGITLALVRAFAA